MSLQVDSILIENIKHIARCELKLKNRSLVVLRGANGTGKTSILDAIRSVFESGGDPTLIRKGAKSGRVELVLSDGTVVKKSITPKGYTLTATGPDGIPIPSPRAYVESLASSFAFDPLAFAHADKKKRVEYLLAAMPITFSSADVGLPGDGTGLTLEGFDKHRAGIYEKRKAANAVVKELEGTIQNLRKSLPQDYGDIETGTYPRVIVASKIKELEQQRNGIDSSEAEDIRNVTEQAAQAYEDALVTYETAMEAARADRNKAVAAIQSAKESAVEEIKASRTTERERIISAVATFQGQLAQEGQHKALAEHLKQQAERRAVKLTEADELNRALEKLDALRKSKLEALPIKGVEVKDGDVWENGVPFDQLNQARQMTLSLEIGALKLGDLGLMVVDETEHLDATNWPAFKEAVEASGLQVIAARVDVGDLAAEPQGSLIA